MKKDIEIEEISFGIWQRAYRCRIGKAALVIVADMGPRIISLNYDNGSNILFEDKENQFTCKNWRLYGGHRFWIGPETEHAFIPDNQLCSVKVAENEITITQKADSMGLEKSLRITSDISCGAFCLKHVVKNIGSLLYPGCIWTLTCVLPGCVVIPWGAGSEAWRCNMVRYWQCWENHQTNPGSEQWQPRRDYFLVKPSGEEGKIGLYSECGYMALLQDHYTFIKTYEPRIEATYPDGGCNIELYTCDKFVEMETLSPNYIFHPGREYSHTEKWILTDSVFEPDQWRSISNQFNPAFLHNV